jgi:hypothetical protein
MNNNYKFPSLGELKHEVEKEVGKSVVLYFSPVVAVAEVIRRNFHDVNQRIMQRRGGSASYRGHDKAEAQ